jgi:hypothetical protein
VAQIKEPGAALPTSRSSRCRAVSDYRARLAQGEVDIVIGNWTTPPDDLHLGALV